MKLSIDVRWICGLLLAVILGMLIVWKPWSKAVSTDKTITVTGEASAEKAPDEYVFYPVYSSNGDTSAVAVQAVSKKGNEVVSKLKELGVKDQQIKTDVDVNGGYFGIEPLSPTDDRSIKNTKSASFRITCKISDKDLAQKITDYLATSGAIGGITPQVQFKEETTKQIEKDLREAATKDAKDKAQAQAKILGVKLGKALKVADKDEGRVIYSYDSINSSAIAEDKSATPKIYPGTQPIRFSVTVTFAIK